MTKTLTLDTFLINITNKQEVMKNDLNIISRDTFKYRIISGRCSRCRRCKTGEKLQVVVADKSGNMTHKEINKSEIPKDAEPAQQQSAEDVKRVKNYKLLLQIKAEI
ncbi:hypothetical protein CN630_30675 [Bacillus wiedmannii]|uniref:Uncharacterized protein n=1 Tax=Bacillus wiedmannii TaxID=1890302 RepID=A0A2C4PY35_9BACI|nr:hypothetical protein [Bacillus wiedmannii]PEN39252.1 hypothetical protein CN630_30675 [Bacillus wiedmannii]PHD57181.1 hypothetical protein COF57_24660 [Bacillus wiedmannii]